MAKASWGRPTIKLGAPDTTGKTIPTQGLQTLLNVKDGSTKLEVSEGEKKELKGEGGVTLDVRRSAPSASLEMEVFILKGDALPTKLKDSSLSLVIVPEDADTPGLYIPIASVSIAEQWTSQEGASVKLRFEPVLAKEEAGVRPFHFTKGSAIYDPYTSTK